MKPILYLGCTAPDRAEAERLLGSGNVSVVWVETLAQALSELQRREMPVLLDLSRDATALQMAREVRTAHPTTLIFAVVDARRPELAAEAVLAGVADVFTRPADGRRVAGAIERESNHQPGHSGAPATAVGATLYEYSQPMRDVMAEINRAATIRAGVMIRGEEGSGRFLAASAIHEAQMPSMGAFVSVDCAQYAGEQLETELFGAVFKSQDPAQRDAPRKTSRSVPRTDPGGEQGGDGAGRGLERLARSSRLFEAREGTIYLRNVAEAPARVQARLARLLRDGEAALAESGETVRLNVRPIVGVDLAFDNAVQDGRVRDDLFRRLSAVRIDMPPLRRRREDLPALANYFLRDICKSLGLPPKTLSRSALSLITALPWRRNGVELRNLLKAIVTRLQGERGIGLDDVLAHVQLDGGSVIHSNGATLRQARAMFEREYITAVLEHHHGRISEAASVLGIQRTNLYRKMRSLRVNRDAPDRNGGRKVSHK